MTRHRRAGLLVAATVLIGIAAHAADPVVHSSVPVESLRRSELRSIFAMRLRQWSDGTPIRVFVLPDANPLHAEFCKQNLGTYAYVLRNTWDRLVFSGTGQSPTTVRTEAELLSRVAETPGAIGYASTPGTDVRVVPVADASRVEDRP